MSRWTVIGYYHDETSDRMAVAAVAGSATVWLNGDGKYEYGWRKEVEAPTALQAMRLAEEERR